MSRRKDNKGRLLKTGESQRKDGRYAYKYQDKSGKSKFLYSWRLTDTDPIPKGKQLKNHCVNWKKNCNVTSWTELIHAERKCCCGNYTKSITL